MYTVVTPPFKKPVAAERCAQLQAASQRRATARRQLNLKEIKHDGFLEHRA
jgi:hypothetical protein